MCIAPFIQQACVTHAAIEPDSKIPIEKCQTCAADQKCALIQEWMAVNHFKADTSTNADSGKSVEKGKICIWNGARWFRRVTNGLTGRPVVWWISKFQTITNLKFPAPIQLNRTFRSASIDIRFWGWNGTCLARWCHLLPCVHRMKERSETDWLLRCAGMQDGGERVAVKCTKWMDRHGPCTHGRGVGGNLAQ